MPFTFLDGSNRVAALISAMDRCGFDSSEISLSSDAYTPSVLRFACRWLPSSSVEVIVHSRWWDDGETIEDSVIEVRENGVTSLSIGVTEMLAMKLDEPLREVLMHEISETARAISGGRRSRDG